jgi:cytochrome P450
MPRKTMTPFTFSDGTYVPTNNWIVVPQQAQMKDPANYVDPETFNGFRFVNRGKGEQATSESRLSHPSWRFPFWGSVKQAW